MTFVLISNIVYVFELINLTSRMYLLLAAGEGGEGYAQWHESNWLTHHFKIYQPKPEYPSGKGAHSLTIKKQTITKASYGNLWSHLPWVKEITRCADKFNVNPSKNNFQSKPTDLFWIKFSYFVIRCQKDKETAATYFRLFLFGNRATNIPLLPLLDLLRDYNSPFWPCMKIPVGKKTNSF